MINQTNNKSVKQIKLRAVVKQICDNDKTSKQI